MNNSENPSYYAVIPANVRYDTRLRANEKLLFGEITALTNVRGYCWASNKYFAELYNVTAQAVSKWISHLKECGYVNVEYIYKNETKEIENRIIKLVSTNDSEVSTNDSEVSTNNLGVSTNGLEGYQQKIKENNTVSNNTTNKKKVSKTAKRQSYDEQIEAYTDNEDLRQALKAFIQMRKLIKKPLTDHALKLNLGTLDKLSDNVETKIAIVNQSVAHDWQGFYPLKNDSSIKQGAKQEAKQEDEEKSMSDFYDENGDFDLNGYMKYCGYRVEE